MAAVMIEKIYIVEKVYYVKKTMIRSISQDLKEPL
jgi:hypothetical protein